MTGDAPLYPFRGPRGKARSWILALALLACLAPRGGARPEAQESTGEAKGLSIGGAVETRPFARWLGPFEPESSSASYGSVTSIRLDLGAGGASFRAAASVEGAILSGDADSIGASVAGSDPRVEARIRSLYLKLDFEPLSIVAGRQIVNYGVGALWSPTDAFTELDLSGISPLRLGSDALRLALSLGDTEALELVAAPKSDFAEGRYAARISGLVPAGEGAGIDAAAIAYRDAGAWSLGASFKADFVAGICGEVLYSMPDSGEGWLRAEGGADWSYDRFVVVAEYYYNGGGASADPNAPGESNVYAALSWRASDLVSLSASCIAGVSADSLCASLGAAIDAAQDASVLAYARLVDAGAGLVYAEAGVALELDF